MKILIIEDDLELREELKVLLDNNGYQGIILKDFKNALEEILVTDPDLILLDIKIPFLNGQQLLKKLREKSTIPVIMVTSKDSEIDEILALSYGADDYITKPYNPTILLLHIEAVFKRLHKAEPKLTYQNIRVNLMKSTLEKDDQELLLSKNEMGIFYYLLMNQGKIVTRDDIMNYLWGTDKFIDDNTLTLEGKILYDALYEIDKSMYEEIETYQDNLKNFKEYIELWIHEVKLPISSVKLMIHNHEHNERKLKDQVSRIENYVEQVLYYARQDSSEKDYLIKQCELGTIIRNVIKKNQDSLLYQNIKIEIGQVNCSVLSDSKWLEFIINQIVSNSIKYRRTDKCKIAFNVIRRNNIALEIIDNGLGIKTSDLTRVFEKSFTGENGRLVSSSTGMGLYIVKRLCDKLGHKIIIESKYSEYTKVTISFNDEQYYKVVR